MLLLGPEKNLHESLKIVVGYYYRYLCGIKVRGWDNGENMTLVVNDVELV